MRENPNSHPSPWQWISKTPPGVLEPMERISEILFGLIMVLTFTGSLSASGFGHGEVRTMLLGALGCNLAWGIIDAFMYLMACFSERGHLLLMMRNVRKSEDPGKAHGLIADAFPPEIASLLLESDLENLRQRLNRLPETPSGPRLEADHWLGALAVFLWVFLSTFPVVIPFTFIRRARLALRISNAIAIGMLFLCGYAFGHYSGHRPWLMGLLMVVVGSALVGITMALGG